MKHLFRHLLGSLFLVGIMITGCTKSGSLSVADSSGATPGGYGLSSGGGGSSGGGNGNGDTTQNTQAGVITAGEWNDLDHWDFWTALMDTSAYKDRPGYWGFNVNTNFKVTLTGLTGAPIIDAVVTLYNASGKLLWAAHTNNHGEARLFPGMYELKFSPGSNVYPVRAAVNGYTYALGTLSAKNPVLEKQLSIGGTVPGTVDILYMVDATGSMGDELEYLKRELEDVLNRAASALPGTQLRMGSVFYRDEGDAYVTRSFPFTTDVGNLVSAIGQQVAEGGGDYPEAVHKALETALQQESWSNSANARLLFMVLDAPPHYTSEVLTSLHKSIEEAASKGITIIPIAASGVDKDTEFLLRVFGIATNGTYVFITDDSGIGNPHLSPTVGHYEVEYLNNLMVRLIKKYGSGG